MTETTDNVPAAAPRASSREAALARAAEFAANVLAAASGVEAMSEEQLLDHRDPCPQGCGWTTEDPYGGPCRDCWGAL